MSFIVINGILIIILNFSSSFQANMKDIFWSIFFFWIWLFGLSWVQTHVLGSTQAMKKPYIYQLYNPNDYRN